MKKLSLLIVVASVILASCGESGNKAPENYTSKVVLEYFSGAWCGWCPDGKKMAEEIVDRVPTGTFDYLVYHAGDMMDILDDDDIDDKFAAGYPSGMVNRLDGEAGTRYTGSLSDYANYNPEKNNAWLIKTKALQSEKALCGLAIDASTLTGNDLNIKVKLGVGPEGLPEGNYYISCILYEEEMSGSGTGWDQVNYMSKFGSQVLGPTHPYYQLGNPIIGYIHTNAVRAIVHSNPLGDGIDAAALLAGTITEFNYTVNLTPFDSDLKVAAWIHEFTEGAIESSSRIYNVQFANVGTSKDFD